MGWPAATRDVHARTGGDAGATSVGALRGAVAHLGEQLRPVDRAAVRGSRSGAAFAVAVVAAAVSGGCANVLTRAGDAGRGPAAVLLLLALAALVVAGTRFVTELPPPRHRVRRRGGRLRRAGQRPERSSTIR